MDSSALRRVVQHMGSRDFGALGFLLLEPDLAKPRICKNLGPSVCLKGAPIHPTPFYFISITPYAHSVLLPACQMNTSSLGRA